MIKAQMADDLLHQKVAAIAYIRNHQMVRDQLQDCGFYNVEFYCDRSTGANAILAHNATHAILAVRGTEKNFADILTDLKFRKERHPEYRIHRGFAEAWRSISGAVQADVSSFRDQGIEVTATGHSLGGAVAVKAATDMWLDKVVTFGAPRIGDDNFGFFVNWRTQHRRYVRGADVVPLVPLMAQGFKHDCAAHYIGADGQLTANCELTRELWGRAKSLFTLDWLMVTEGRLPCPAPKRMFTDHRITGYGADLQRLLETHE